MSRSISATGNRVARDADTQEDSLASQWSRLGAGLTVAAAPAPVDIEQLIVATLYEAPSDPRLFWVMVAWLSVHGVFVDRRQLVRRLDALAGASEIDSGAGLASAIGGAAFGIVAEWGGPTAKIASSIQQHCQPLQTTRALFDRVAKSRVLSALARDESLPVFSRWGLWYHEVTDARDAIRSVAGMLASAPELHIRSVLGTDLSSAIVARLSHARESIAELVLSTGATRIAVNDAVTMLVARGLVTKPRDGYRKPISLAPGLARWLLRAPSAPRR